MLDLGVSKLALIGIVALIVLGPERLPKVARIVGTLIGRAQRYMRDVKDEVSKDMDLQELKKMGLAGQETLSDLKEEIDHVWHDAKSANVGVETSLKASPLLMEGRHGRKHWGVRSVRPPQWYRLSQRMPSRLSTEAARMKKHRSYAAHLQQKSHSFFR